MRKDWKLVLASNSPRRKELLRDLGMEYTVRTVAGIDESFPAGLSAEETAMYIAKKKAKAYESTIQPDELLITADTIVYLGGQVLGKPHSLEEASEMLRALSGRTHQVVTGVTLNVVGKQRAFAVVSNVTFSELTDEEINYYVETYLPLDKAGAYGIQEWIGMVGVERLEGSFFNVMGLPVQRLYSELKCF